MDSSLFQEALRDAYQEQIAKLFDCFVDNMTGDEKEAVKEFETGLALVNRAYETAQQKGK